MPDDLDSNTSAEKRPGLPVPKRPEPTDTVVQHAIPHIALDPNMPAPPVGYELLSEVGRGGMGVVYRARDLALGRDVAIKILHQSGPGTKQFLEEASIAGQLQHPGIPPVHHIGELPDGRPFLVMRFIQGSTLKVLLSENVDRARLLDIFEKLCEAISYAHERGVIHRDLKPSNVMVGAFGEVQVMDWGIAKAGVRSQESGDRGQAPDVSGAAAARRSEDKKQGTGGSEFRIPDSENTLPGSVMGTPSYMSPEQAAGEVDRIDRRADVFALGGVLCAILTGRAPYIGESAIEIQLKAIGAATADAFAALDASGADPELIALAKKCLSEKPDDRPRDAGEVAQAVAAFRTSTETRAWQAELTRLRAEAERDLSRAKPSGSSPTRRAVLFGLPMLALAAGGAYFAFSNRDPAPPVDSTNNESPSPSQPPVPVPPAVLVPQREVGGAVASVAVSDDGRWLAVALGDGTMPMKTGGVKLFDRSRGQAPEVWWKWRETSCRGVAFSPDGKLLAVAAGSTLRVLNLADGQEIAFADAAFEGFAETVVFSPNGKYLALAVIQSLAADKTPRPSFACVWDTTTRGKPIRFERGKLPARSVAFSPDSTLLALGLGVADGDLGSVVEMWNVATGAHSAQIDAPLAVSGPHVAFARTGPRCAISSQDRINFYEPPSTVALKNEFITNPAGETTSLALRPDGAVLAFAVGVNIYLGEVETGIVYATLGKHGEHVVSLTFTRDSKTLLSGGYDGIVREWSVPNPK